MMMKEIFLYSQLIFVIGEHSIVFNLLLKTRILVSILKKWILKEEIYWSKKTQMDLRSI